MAAQVQWHLSGDPQTTPFPPRVERGGSSCEPNAIARNEAKLVK
jgi:hypothetical protein